MLSVTIYAIMLCAMIPNVIMLSVIILNVASPFIGNNVQQILWSGLNQKYCYAVILSVVIFNVDVLC